ncbi:MAG: hypothetical protein ABEK01_03620 [Candidatus Nanohaloarchaea archaeon]
MRSAVQVLVAIVVALLVVAGVYGIASMTLDRGESNIGSFANNIGNQISCVFANQENTDVCGQKGGRKGG